MHLKTGELDLGGGAKARGVVATLMAKEMESEGGEWGGIPRLVCCSCRDPLLSLRTLQSLRGRGMEKGKGRGRTEEN